MFDSNKIKKIISDTIIDESIYNISVGRSGLPTLKVKFNDCSFFMNSKYNPQKESDEFVQEYFQEGKDIILYGLGMGYHVKAIYEKMADNNTLYILEFNKEIVKIAFENTDISEILSKKNVVLEVPDSLDEAVSFIAKTTNNDNAVLIVHEPSVRAMPSEFEKIKDIFETILIRRRSSAMLGSLLSDNEKINLTKGYENGGKVFKDKFKGKKAIVVSAGPSLELNGELLKNVNGRAVIISVGRAYKYLKSIGITPDFVVLADAKPDVVDQLDLEETETTLIFLSTIYPTVENYKGPKYILFEKYSDSISDEDRKYAVETGGSVATTSLSFAELIGCCKIALIGQDLCYHSNKMHSGEDSSFTEVKTNKKVKGISGEEYTAPLNLYEYLKWFRKFAIKHKNIHLYNCTAKGAFIDGFTHIGINEFLDV